MTAPNRRVRVSDEVRDLIRSMHPHIKKKIRASLEAILEEPASGKPLRHDLEGLWSFRVSHFRVIYRVSRNIIEVIAIGPRASIYTETLRLIRRDETSASS